MGKTSSIEYTVYCTKEITTNECYEKKKSEMRSRRCKGGGEQVDSPKSKSKWGGVCV